MTSIFPITYIALVIWLLFTFVPSNNIIGLIGSFFGYIVSLTSAGGEQWLNVSSSNVLSIQTFNSGFEPWLSIITITMNMAITSFIVLNVIEMKNESGWSKALGLR